MPFESEQAQLLQKHLKGKRIVCPLCDTKVFQLVEVISIPIQGVGLIDPRYVKLFPELKEMLSPDDDLGIKKFTSPLALGSSNEQKPRTLPVAIMSCTNCHYLMQFAWMPIVHEALGG